MGNVTLFSRTGPKVIPQRITEARQSAGMNMADLGREIGVSRQAISYFETGARQPEADVLSRLGRALDLPIAYFTSERPSGHGPSGTIFFRSFASKTKTVNKKCEVYKDWLDQTTRYLGSMVKLPPVHLPDTTSRGDADRYTAQEIENLATACRRLWGLGDGPISNIILLMESKGIIVARTNMEAQAIDAFSCWIGSRPFVLLSSDRTAVRSRFDAAHELGHLLMHSGISAEQMEDPEIHKRVESEAHRFAGAFLLPRQTFPKEVSSTRLPTFIELKKRWKVSIAAMQMRCKNLRMINDPEFIRLRKLLSHYGYLKHEPLDNEISHEEPSVLRRAVEMICAKAIKGPADILADLRLSPKHISAITGAESEMFRFSEPDFIDLHMQGQS